MKKLILFAIIGLALSVSPAVAAVTFSNAATGSGTAGLLAGYRTSTKVTLIGLGSVSAYNAVAGHLQGNEMYGSSGGDSVIYENVTEKTPGTAVAVGNVPAIPATNSDTSGFGSATTWAPM